MEDNQFKNLDNNQAEELERKHVYEIYDKIASEFSDSRYRAWPNVKKFIENLPEGTILIDLGTGNGKNLKLNDKIINIGCDTSIKLLNICRNNNLECLASNVLNLPFKDESIDACIYIAVLHHLVTEERRLESLRNINRILKKDGECLVYVWAFEQEIKGNKSNYIKQKYDLELEDEKLIKIDLKNNQDKNEKLMPIHFNGTKFKHQDCFVPWKKKNEIIPLENTDLRYYHLFKENELDNLIKNLDNVQIIDSYYDNGNWACRFKKI